MIVSRFSGRLGNQMFQYACGRCCALRNKTELKIIKKSGLQIVDVFPKIKLDILNKGERSNVTKNKKIYPRVCDYGNPYGFRKDIIISNLGNIFLKGYWQNHKYFEDYKDFILDQYIFKVDNLSGNETVLEIKRSNSVSVHFRFGDYLVKSYHSCTDKDGFLYYKKAIRYIQKYVDNPKFFVFSDDMKYMHKHVDWFKDIKNVVYVTGNKNQVDLELMSLCKHNIMANSTFSWWAALLNKNTNKIVIYPEIWVARNRPLINYIEGWLRIDN